MTDEEISGMGRHDLIDRVRELEAENARWVARIKRLEASVERARALLAGERGDEP